MSSTGSEHSIHDRSLDRSHGHHKTLNVLVFWSASFYSKLKVITLRGEGGLKAEPLKEHTFVDGSIGRFDAWNVFVCIFEDFTKMRLEREFAIC